MKGCIGEVLIEEEGRGKKGREDKGLRVRECMEEVLMEEET